MKRFIVSCLVLTISLFFIGGCNTPNDDNGGGLGDGEEGVFDWGNPGYKNTTILTPTNESDQWPGYELDLADCPNKPDNLGDISLYSNVILTAVLYDRKGDKFPTATQPSALEAQFHILAASSSGWGDENKLATKNNLVLEGESTASVSKTGQPGKVLVQARYQSSKQDTEQVGFIEIQKVVFVPKVSDVVIEIQYDTGGGHINVQGNKIMFTNSMFRDAAAIYKFPTEWGTGDQLANKTITFNYRIEAHDSHVLKSGAPANPSVAHEIHIQAAQKEGDKYNGKHDNTNSNKGQQYVTLDNKTSFTISASALITASKESEGFDNDGSGPFTLDSVRIVNNGDMYDNVYKCMTYTLIFDSITISP